jgi:hypothetical protein
VLTVTYFTQTSESDSSGLAGYSLEGCVALCDGSTYDAAIFCNSGTCNYNAAPSSFLHLGAHWSNVEWNVFGKSGLGEELNPSTGYAMVQQKR